MVLSGCLLFDCVEYFVLGKYQGIFIPLNNKLASKRNFTMNIESLSWHDGIFKGYGFSPNYESKSVIVINVDLYPEQIHASERDALNIVCTDIDWFKLDVSMADLNENESAGNINHGEMLGNILRVQLFGGDLLIKAESFIVEKC